MSKAQETLYEMRWASYLTAKDAEADQQKLKLKQAYDAARASESVRKRSLFSRPLAAPPTSTATTARVDAESLSRFIAERSAD